MKIWKKALDEGKSKEIKEGKNEARTPAVVENEDECLQVIVYNVCCVGLHNEKCKVIEHSPCIKLVLYMDLIIHQKSFLY
jgi:hypothetical protein